MINLGRVGQLVGGVEVVRCAERRTVRESYDRMSGRKHAKEYQDIF